MTWGMGSIISPSFIKLLGVKGSIILGGIANSIYMLSSLLATINRKDVHHSIYEGVYESNSTISN
jgi:hypothetical protein